MTKDQALQVGAARELLAELERTHRDGAYTTGNDRAANDARLECAAGSAKDVLTNYLIMVHVYGDDDTQALAAAALEQDYQPEPEPEPDGDVSDVSIYGAGVK